MRRYSIKVAVFIIGFFIFSFLIKALLFATIRTIDIGDYGVLNRIVEGKINTDILISGSSRGYVGINPNVVMEKTNLNCFNISQNGKRFGVQLPLLKTYLKHNKKPKIMIQEIGLYSVGLENGINDIHKYLPYLYEDILYNGLRQIDSELWKQKFVPFMNFYYFHSNFQRRVFRDFVLFLKEGKDYLINGFHPNNSNWTINETDFLKGMGDGFNSPIDEKPIESLKEIVKICLENNIQLIFVYTPDYYKFPPFQKNREEIIKIFKSLAEKKNVFFLDYKDIPLAKDKRNFYNFRHLNANGARKFTEHLSEDLIVLGTVEEQNL